MTRVRPQLTPGPDHPIALERSAARVVVRSGSVLLWLLTGNFANPGGQYVPTSLVNLVGNGSSGSRSSGGRRTSVANALIISGLVPCNVIAEEILTDRYRAMLVESANPA